MPPGSERLGFKTLGARKAASSAIARKMSQREWSRAPSDLLDLDKFNRTFQRRRDDAAIPFLMEKTDQLPKTTETSVGSGGFI